jgi:AAA+ ATPase superfamily predicted ATPase
MKFIDRETELNTLRRIETASKATAQMSFVVGRRRTGKTTLIKESFKQGRFVYLFVSKKNEVLLCEEFVATIKALTDIKIFGDFTTFRELFSFLMEVSKKTPLTLAIDEFQEFAKVNGSIYSEMQDIWDSNKHEAKINLVLSGSIFSLMKKIFENEKEPLFGRADHRIHLKPFPAAVIKNLFAEHCPNYANEDLLTFFILTGGMAKYVEFFVDRKIFSRAAMLDSIFSPNSLFLEEGKNLLIEELGKEYGTYFSILSLIASSKTSRREIESILEKNIGGYLDRLETEYCIIKKVKPIFAKANSRTQKYYIDDNFLNFWFRYVYTYRSAIEIGNFDALKSYVADDFSSYSGRFLEKYFIDQLIASRRYTEIGTYWESGNRNEIDIVAVNEFSKQALVAEVKLNPKKFSLNELKFKAQGIERNLKGYRIDYKGLSLEDM